VDKQINAHFKILIIKKFTGYLLRALTEKCHKAFCSSSRVYDWTFNSSYRNNYGPS